ncbi:MAG TPA: DeoR/GlpR family DNA-binding transcription regulator [Phycisphaerae bacterium]|nr:DeoR/GlpR family DNA-binding transcription regulator [Phycisphaerae bacterium]
MVSEIAIVDRRTRVAELLSTKGFASLAELTHSLGVSESTIRRDLEVLEEQGVVRRTHGGAVFVQDSSGHRLAFADRETTALAEKQAIGGAVAGLIAENETVIINGGTTCCEVARALRGRRLNVITNSVPIASVLSTELATEVTFVGGYIYPRTGVALGQMAEQMLADLHASRLILSCAGLTEEGAFNANQMMVDVERGMMGIADEVILVADHTKFGMRAVVKLCDLDEVGVIVTDDGVDDESRSWLGALKAKVVYAG